ncbi:MAG: isoprenoid biosynthesis glyoxalase ElbB [Bacteroidales bacterium]|jgi:enhancing lycopene biosynthesis protein 2|nr:isoprenoid biosynthesis glyoxalase ElbB [Bacteroidales bacterium]
MMKRFALILSGCGVYDGAEIHESVSTMIAIRKAGAEYQLFAPNREQYHVVNHLTGEEMDEKRNVLVESARIARGQIKDIIEFDPKDFDAIIFPGGFGAAKNLSDYAFKGSSCRAIPEIEKAIKDTIESGKPLGAECIAPVVMAAVLKGATVTIGSDEATAKDIEQLDGHHIVAEHNGVIYDRKYNLYTTPCYMAAQNILEVYESAEALVNAMMRA